MLDIFHETTRKRGDDRYWIFPSTEDCHHLRYSSILKMFPQVDIIEIINILIILNSN